MTNAPQNSDRYLPVSGLGELLQVLRMQGYTTIGPRIDQGAIIYAEVESLDDLPRGWTDEQRAGAYRLVNNENDRYFGYVVGPHSWKRYLFPPEARLAQAEKTTAGWQFTSPEVQSPRYAFLGVRACELAAIGVQDRTFLNSEFADPIYQARRADALLIAVNCTTAASTCFCTSMGTGPRCTSGFDIALTEIGGGFVVEVATQQGQDVVDCLRALAVTPEQLQEAEGERENAVRNISKRMDTTDIRDLLMNNLNHSRWDEVAARCLSCTNCTMVCPTCFCASVHEVADLQGERVERNRVWDSCFNFDFSYLNGGVIRDQIRSRYRQWLTHKLASWIDQFGVSGCVGCGRCITWCPVAIDLTEEVAAIREQQL